MLVVYTTLTELFGRVLSYPWHHESGIYGQVMTLNFRGKMICFRIDLFQDFPAEILEDVSSNPRSTTPS